MISNEHKDGIDIFYQKVHFSSSKRLPFVFITQSRVIIGDKLFSQCSVKPQWAGRVRQEMEGMSKRESWQTYKWILTRLQKACVICAAWSSSWRWAQCRRPLMSKHSSLTKIINIAYFIFWSCKRYVHRTSAWKGTLYLQSNPYARPLRWFD